MNKYSVLGKDSNSGNLGHEEFKRVALSIASDEVYKRATERLRIYCSNNGKDEFYVLATKVTECLVREHDVNYLKQSVKKLKEYLSKENRPKITQTEDSVLILIRLLEYKIPNLKNKPIEHNFS